MYYAKFLNAALLVMACMTATAARAEVVFVVSAKSNVSSLSADQVSDIFLGRANSFPSGGQAVPVDQHENSPAREEFYGRVTNKNAAQLKAYWSKIIFTGKGQPPKEVADSTAVRKLVADNPNIIGYVDKSALDATIKPVFTVH